MSFTTPSEFSCPDCMAINQLEVDEDNELNRAQIVDCQLCCSPIEITITLGVYDKFNIIANTDNE